MGHLEPTGDRMSRRFSRTATKRLRLGGALLAWLFIAAVAGFLSFASPCVLPLVPAYIGLIGGYAVNNTQKSM